LVRSPRKLILAATSKMSPADQFVGLLVLRAALREEHRRSPEDLVPWEELRRQLRTEE